MTYQEAMLEKKVEKTELPKKIQGKIEKIEEAKDKVSELDAQDDLNVKERELLESLKKHVAALDSELTKEIMKFNPENYKRRMENLHKMTEIRKQNVAKKKGLVKADDQQIAKHLEELKETAKIEPEDYVEEEWNNEKQAMQPSRPPMDELCEDCQHELYPEEFEKVSDAKPRKSSRSLIIMGIGAFILTWGAVNFFRERR